MIYRSILMLLFARAATGFTLAPRAAGARAGVRALQAVAAEEFTSATDNEFDGYSNACAAMFPGQGAQFVGMGAEVADIPKAKELYDIASEILGYDLLARSMDGPKDVLDTTAASQPAIFVNSMAAVEKLRAEQGQEAVDKFTVAMGLSLGEYSALCFAGALSFEDGVRLTKARGEAMQAAADACDSSMVSVIGLDADTVAALCEKAAEATGKDVRIANFLCPGNYAVSGASEACDEVERIAKPDFEARMTVRLAVAGAFHTEFMAPAVDALGEALEKVDISKPRIPVVSNVDAKAHSDPAVIKEILKKQVTSPVLWEESMKAVLGDESFEGAFELGPGKVICGIAKRIDRRAAIEPIGV